MARLALVLQPCDLADARASRLCRILDFFGIPWEPVTPSRLGDRLARVTDGSECAVLASIKTFGEALGGPAVSALRRAAALYLYADVGDTGEETLSSLWTHRGWFLGAAPRGFVSLKVTETHRQLAGPMAGLQVSARLGETDRVLVRGGGATGPGPAGLVTAAGAPVFVGFQHEGVPAFLCTSPEIVDIDQPVPSGFYDVKDHFSSVVPLVMFLAWAFSGVMWRPRESGACLIIDDPLLKSSYGFCDFRDLRAFMARHGFTTNIAFIPWNWRRTSSEAAEFFRREAAVFSVSIHGCDHVAGEFGVTSVDLLDARARVARTRMEHHRARTGIRHDAIMVFPQGVFSSQCPEVLKRNAFIAAVNTEVTPVDRQHDRTRIRDVWDVAIMRYGAFPVFTRRYLFHGMENFAFDLLLGKPCLIVTHHEFFGDGCAGLVEFLERLSSLNCSLRWRSLGEVIRRACRHRPTGSGAEEEVEMYGNELLIANPSKRAVDLTVRRREGRTDLVAEVQADQSCIPWTMEQNSVVFRQRILPESEPMFRVVYKEYSNRRPLDRSVRFKLSVAARRILSEFRDEYMQKLARSAGQRRWPGYFCRGIQRRTH